MVSRIYRSVTIVAFMLLAINCLLAAQAAPMSLENKTNSCREQKQEHDDMNWKKVRNFLLQHIMFMIVQDLYPILKSVLKSIIIRVCIHFIRLDFIL